MPRRLLVINGPILNLLGRREPEVDGRTTLADITAGALTHTRVAVRDALVRVAIAFVEVPISNVCRRKAFSCAVTALRSNSHAITPHGHKEPAREVPWICAS